MDEWQGLLHDIKEHACSQSIEVKADVKNVVENEVASVNAKVDKLETDMASMRAKVDEILDLLRESKTSY